MKRPLIFESIPPICQATTHLAWCGEGDPICGYVGKVSVVPVPVCTAANEGGAYCFLCVRALRHVTSKHRKRR